MKNYKWQVLGIYNNGKLKSSDDLLNLLLENRNLKSKKEKEEFLSPTELKYLNFENLGVSQDLVNKAIKRIENAVKKDEGVLVYGDYDADGICATAILWECIYTYTKKVVPHIPDRFTEGYGINKESVDKIISENRNLKLIITVDNGIVAHEAVDYANKLGIDVIVIDHHEKEKNLPAACAIVHSKQTSGAGLAWFFAREVESKFKTKPVNSDSAKFTDLAAIGVIADQLPLIGVNRSLVKYGIEALKISSRPGLKAIFEISAVDVTKIDTYEIGFQIAPRINAMGRLKHGIDSLRLLCTKDVNRAKALALQVNDTNSERQKVVEDVVAHAMKIMESDKNRGKIIVLYDENYHEGVIGLAAAKLVEKFYLPSIVISKGEFESKGSARSIYGVNIINLIRQSEDLLIGGGGHEMAAGFSIKNENLELFIKRLSRLAEGFIADELLEKRLKIDCEIDFGYINQDLLENLDKMKPFGIGNYAPVFCSKSCSVVDVKLVGSEAKHLKLKLKNNSEILDAIGFGMGDCYESVLDNKIINVAFTPQLDTWSGNNKIQLVLKDIHYNKL